MRLDHLLSTEYFLARFAPVFLPHFVFFLFVWGLLTRKVLLGRGMSMFLGSRAVSFGEGFLRLRRGARFLRFLFFAAGLRFDNWTVDASNAGFVPALL